MEILSMFRGSKASDCVLKCGTAELKVEQHILRSQSPFFEAVLGGCFKKGQTALLKMDSFKMNHIQAMVEYMYTANYSITNVVGEPDSPDTTDASMVANEPSFAKTGQVEDPLEVSKFHMEVGIVAGYYEIPSLQDLARRKLGKSLGGVQTEDLPEVLNMAEQRRAEWETKSVIAGVVAEKMEDLETMDCFQALNLSGDFQTLIQLHQTCQQKATEAVSKRLQDILPGM